MMGRCVAPTNHGLLDPSPGFVLGLGARHSVALNYNRPGRRQDKSGLFANCPGLELRDGGRFSHYPAHQHAHVGRLGRYLRAWSFPTPTRARARPARGLPRNLAKGGFLARCQATASRDPFTTAILTPV